MQHEGSSMSTAVAVRMASHGPMGQPRHSLDFEVLDIW
jgi:hypothetical protein